MLFFNTRKKLTLTVVIGGNEKSVLCWSKSTKFSVGGGSSSGTSRFIFRNSEVSKLGSPIGTSSSLKLKKIKTNKDNYNIIFLFLQENNRIRNKSCRWRLCKYSWYKEHKELNNNVWITLSGNLCEFEPTTFRATMVT